MKRFINSFYGKISAVFLFILLILGITQTYITIDSCFRLIDEARHKLNAPLAANIASYFEPYLQNGNDHNRIEQAIEGMMMINPEIEIYFLDNNGKILRAFMRPGHQARLTMVSLQPLRQFLDNPRIINCVGDDPCQPGQQKIFSVAPIQFNPSQAGFVYVVQGAEAYRATLEMLMHTHIGRSSITVSMVTLIFTAIVGVVLFRMLTGRFQKMTGVVTRFTKGDLSQRIPVQSDDEVGQLAKTFKLTSMRQISPWRRTRPSRR